MQRALNPQSGVRLSDGGWIGTDKTDRADKLDRAVMWGPAPCPPSQNSVPRTQNPLSTQYPVLSSTLQWPSGPRHQSTKLATGVRFPPGALIRADKTDKTVKADRWVQSEPSGLRTQGSGLHSGAPPRWGGPIDSLSRHAALLPARPTAGREALNLEVVVRIHRRELRTTRADSSAGRAPVSHTGSRWFDPSSAYRARRTGRRRRARRLRRKGRTRRSGRAWRTGRSRHIQNSEPRTPNPTQPSVLSPQS
jgi:hypothetical protein